MKIGHKESQDEYKKAVLEWLDYRSFYRKHIPSLKLNGKVEAQGLCCFHDDRHPSISVNLDSGLFYCFACGASGDVFSFFMKKDGVDFPKALQMVAKEAAVREEGIVIKKKKDSSRKIIATYDYTDKHGQLMFQVCRTDQKGFPQRRPDGKGGWKWGIDGIEPVLYNLPKVISSYEIFIVEGEKDADALIDLGYVASTAPMGAGKWRDSFAQALKGKLVYILPDNDEPGQKHAEYIAQSLIRIAKTIKIVKLPNLPPKGDVSDFIEALGTEQADVEIARLVETMPEWKQEANVLQIEPFKMDSEPDLSHDALALELSEVGWKRDARYVNTWGRWLFFDNTHWQMDDSLRHMTKIRIFLRAIARAITEWADKKASELENEDKLKAKKIRKWGKNQATSLRQAPLRANVESTARSNSDLVGTVEQFDADILLLGTPRGVVDLRTGELRGARREDYITKLTAVAPANEGTLAPLWQSFLERIFNGDYELINFMQRLAGYALTGETSEHCLAFCYGTGANGKSVFLNTIYAIIGDYAKRAPSETFLDNSNDRHPTDKAGLCGARLVLGSELPPGRSWNEAAIKDLTGGDPISARFMRQDFFTFIPQFTLIIAGNHQPSLRSVDEGLRRRVRLVPFSVTIPEGERDPELFEKLKEEWPAILRWAINGAVEWQKKGLAAPERVMAASKEYIDSEDLLGEFMEDCLVVDPGGFVSTRDLYTEFRAWSEERGMRMPWTQRALTRTLRERGMIIKRRSAGNGLLDFRLKKMDEDNEF